MKTTEYNRIGVVSLAKILIKETSNPFVNLSDKIIEIILNNNLDTINDWGEKFFLRSSIYQNSKIIISSIAGNY